MMWPDVQSSPDQVEMQENKYPIERATLGERSDSDEGSDRLEQLLIPSKDHGHI